MDKNYTLVSYLDLDDLSGRNRVRVIKLDRMHIRMISDFPVSDQIRARVQTISGLSSTATTVASELSYKKLHKYVTEIKYTINLNTPQQEPN